MSTREAAERLSPMIDVLLKGAEAPAEMYADAVTLAAAYLAEHDETPVTKTWLYSLGACTGNTDIFVDEFVWDVGGDEYDYCGFRSLTIRWHNVSDSQSAHLGFINDIAKFEVELPAVRTRGAVCRLAVALGIDLKEPEGASK